jgi:YD repeat-containing protein
MAIACFAAACLWVSLRGDVLAQDPPPTLSVTVRADGSKPPVGFYPKLEFPYYDPHPTAYFIAGVTTEWALPLGNELPAEGASSFTGTTADVATPRRFVVRARVPGKRTRLENPAAFHEMEPYFRADQLIACPSPACSAPLDVTLHAKWGNVFGRVTLLDGTLPPRPLWVVAKPVGTIPVGADSFFRQESTPATLAGGGFSFAKSALVQDNPAVWQCMLPHPYTCHGVAFDPANHWGLRVLGNGGVTGEDLLNYSNGPGKFSWSIELSSKRKTLVEVESSKGTEVSFQLTLDEAFEAFDEQMENRPWEDDAPECSVPVDDAGNSCDGAPSPLGCLGAGGPEGAPHPVALLTGNVYVDHEDARLPGVRHDLVLTRSYNSANAGRAGVLGRGWTHSFEKRIEVVSAQILRLWGPKGVPSYFTDPEGVGRFTPFGVFHPASTITRRADGTFLRVFRTGGSEEYREDGRLLKRVDRAGRAIVLSWNGNRLSEIVSPEGRKLRFESFVTLDRIVGPEGTIAEYTYRGGSLLSRVQYADGTGYLYSYDSDGRLTTVSDLAGVVIDRHGYSGGKAAWSELNGGRERRSYSYEADRTLVTDARGTLSAFQIVRKRPRRFVGAVSGCGFCGAQGGTQRWDYDDEGRVTRYVDADDNPTSYTWDGPNLASVTNALGLTTVYADHDEFGRPRSVTRPGFGTTTYAYAPEGVTSVRLPTGQVTTFTYEDQRLKSVLTAGGTELGFDIDALGDLRSFTDGRDQTTRYTRDVMGRVQSVTTPDGRTSTLERAGGARLAAVKRPDGKRAFFDYDRSGRISGFTNEAGQRVGYGYDAYDRIEAHIDALGGVTRLGYDSMSNLTSLTDARAQTTRFEYDSFGRVEAMVDPMGGRDSLEYYPSGRLRAWTDRKGIRKSYTYDGVGRLRAVSFSDGSPTHSVEYDDLARSVTLANGTDTVTLAFDQAGRLASETSSLNGTTVGYTYTDDHLPETLSLDGSLIARYVHEAGYLQSIDGIAGRFAFGYDDAGRRQTSPTRTASRPPRLRPRARLAAGDPDRPGWQRAMFEFAYTHDDVGNRLTRSEPGRTERYGYDSASRLLTVERTGDSPANASFSYDPVGNRTSDAQEGQLRSLRYDTRNRLLEAGPAATLRVSGTTSEPATVTVQGQPARLLPDQGFEGEAPAAAPPGDTELTVEARDASGNVRTNTYRVPSSTAGTGYGYDAHGNMTSKVDGSGNWTYEWNAQNQLVRVTKDGLEVARFSYDPLGRRVRKVAGGVTYSYVYSGMDILQETVAATTYRYIHGPGIDEPLARMNVATSAVEYYHADGLGSIVRMTDRRERSSRPASTTPGATRNRPRSRPASPSQVASGIPRLGSTTTELDTTIPRSHASSAKIRSGLRGAATSTRS